MGKRELGGVVVAAAVWGMLGMRPEPEPPAAPPRAPVLLPALPPDRISGRVVDALTGQPVKRATVQGWGRLRVDPDGGFAAQAHQDVSLLVAAPYYERQKVVLEPGRFREIRLVPATPVD